MTRMISIVLLLLHFYFYAYSAFFLWKLTSPLTNRILDNIGRTGLFNHFFTSKLISLGFLLLSLMGTKGRKSLSMRYSTAFNYLGAGLLLYFGSVLLFSMLDDTMVLGVSYMTVTGSGYLLTLTGGSYISRIVANRGENDVFNRFGQSFPQEQRRITHPYSINLPARYQYKGRTKDSWINLVNIFRGCMLAGNPGSSKTISFVEPVIRQALEKKFSLVVYDFKYDDLSKVTYNYFLKYRNTYEVKPAFYNINFHDLSRSHGSNPLHPSTLETLSDAGEASRTILVGLNMEWMAKSGDFWVESSVNFVKALIWFLRQYKKGQFCTWPHVIELAQIPKKKLFTVLQIEPQIKALIAPFIDALVDNNKDQLGGQMASTTISLAKLSSPEIYYVMTGNDFTLDINNPDAPKILCLGNHPQRSSVYGPVLGVYINTINRLANRKGAYPLLEMLDEGSSLAITSLDKTLAYGRQNMIAIFIVIQDLNQLRLAYGHKYADVLFNLCGNIFCGQGSGDTAKQMSERFGKTVQTRESISVNSRDTNFTTSDYLEQAIPASRIASLSAGEFVGMVADMPDYPIELKAFCAKMKIDYEALNEEKKGYQALPKVRAVTQEMLLANFLQIQKDVEGIITSEIGRIRNSPELEDLLLE